MRTATSIKFRSHGFTLVEMAIVLMIVGLLLGGLLVPLSAQMEQRNVTETRKQLDEIQQALIGFAVINGRLPCPASSTSNGVESPSGGNCSNFYNGFVPAATLGVTSVVDNQGNTGFAVDSWGNRIHYAVTSWSSTSPALSNVFTTTSGMSTVGISNLSPTLLVCSTATGISGSSCASGAALTSNGVPAIIFSTGKNGAQGGAGTDEAANLNGTNVTFVSHSPTPNSAANGEFDDIVIWISPNVLINRMVTAGKLP
jgi:prepilin-type N-terminal cleavage/methylation domain-containing protein